MCVFKSACADDGVCTTGRKGGRGRGCVCVQVCVGGTFDVKIVVKY